MSFAHRARAGFQEGPNAIVYNFFRNLRAQVATHDPDRVTMALEGRPKHRHAALDTYKANREIPSGPEHDSRRSEMNNFYEQITTSIEIIRECFPITLLKHPDFEADDTIANFVYDHPDDVIVIVSTDTDFIQLVSEHVRLYNPTKKSFVDAPPYDYVSWKSLRGDSSDNISGIPRIGDRRAQKIIESGTLDRFLEETGTQEIYERNRSLISLKKWTVEDREKLIIHEGTSRWDVARTYFDNYGFGSITNDKSWRRYTETF